MLDVKQTQAEPDSFIDPISLTVKMDDKTVVINNALIENYLNFCDRSFFVEYAVENILKEKFGIVEKDAAKQVSDYFLFLERTNKNENFFKKIAEDITNNLAINNTLIMNLLESNDHTKNVKVVNTPRFVDQYGEEHQTKFAVAKNSEVSGDDFIKISPENFNVFNKQFVSGVLNTVLNNNMKYVYKIVITFADGFFKFGVYGC